MEPRSGKALPSVGESGVYSFTNEGSENTSTTCSFSVSSSMEESKASSSGCSSMVYSEKQVRKKQLMKNRVKRCLEELKTLMHDPHAPKKKGDTLKTLQHVVKQMKKYKEGAGGSGHTPRSSVDNELVGVTAGGECAGVPFLHFPNFDSNTWFRIVTSDNENTILDAPSDLFRMLRYPVKYWCGQPLLEYIHKRDVVTISSHLVSAQMNPSECKEEMDNREESSNNIFFFRMRHYKSIRQGYSLSRAEKYSVFCGRVSRQKVDLSSVQLAGIEGRKPNNEYAVLECSPVDTGYTEAYRPPKNNTFFTRHTVHCKYNFVHPSCIPLTGYLPQDLIGTSIFDLYHPQDLHIILESYQHVAATSGETFKSKPYRLRIKNGQYIILETEWSSYINPWSNQLDFIIGHHNVIEGPQNIEVFNEGRRHTLEVTLEARSLQKRIRTLLLKGETVTKEPSNTEAGPSSIPDVKPDAETMTNTSTTSALQVPLPTDNCDKAMEMEGTNNSSTIEEGKNVTANRDSQVQLLDAEKANIYEQLNYAHNIRRFLYSCAVTQQACGDSSSSKSTLQDENLELFADKAASNAVNLRPPSFASSTKALVSEREQWEELMPPSPTHEETVEEVPSVTEDTYQHIPLTEEVIDLHNKYQLQTYISSLACEKNMFSRPANLQLHLKRQHGDDEDKNEPEIKHKKEVYMEQTGERSSPNPSELIFPCSLNEQPTFNNPNRPNHPLYRAAHHNAPTKNKSTSPKTAPSAAAGAPTGIDGMRWPCFDLDRGFSYMAVPGSYLPPVKAQPMVKMSQRNPNKFTPPSGQRKGATSNGGSTLNTMSNSKSCGKTSDSSGSLDDYSSSAFFLLDSGSQNNSHDTPSELEEQNRSSRKILPWRASVKWDKEIAMQYTLAYGNSDKVLEMDRMHLKKCMQPIAVEQQMQELLSEGMQPDIFLMDDDHLIQPPMPHEVDGDAETQEEVKPEENKEDVSSSEQNAMVSGPKSGEQELSEEKQKNVSDSDSNDGNLSKSSSEITPSDQRSHDELPSSGKESDNDNISSKPQQRASKCEPGPDSRLGEYLLRKLYVPLNVAYQPLASPSWLANANFSEAVQMTYQKSPEFPLQDVLRMDQQHLSNMEQPRAVQEQLKELLADLKEKVSFALTPLTPKENNSLESNSGSGKSDSNNMPSTDISSPSSGMSNASSTTSCFNYKRKYPSPSSSAEGEGSGKDQGPARGGDVSITPMETHPACQQESSGSERDSVIKCDCFSPENSDDSTGMSHPALDSRTSPPDCCSITTLIGELENKTNRLGGQHSQRQSVRQGEKGEGAKEGTPESEGKNTMLGIIKDLFTSDCEMETD